VEDSTLPRAFAEAAHRADATPVRRDGRTVGASSSSFHAVLGTALGLVDYLGQCEPDVSGWFRVADASRSVVDTLPEPQRRAIDFVLLRADDEGPVSDHRAVGAALLSVLDRLAADMPVLLAIDDYQWVDTPSAQVIEFAVRRLSSPVGVVAALRTGERGGQEPWLRLPDPGRVQRVRVGPLSLGALHQMLRERAERSFPRPVLARIQQVSGGNPFFALELARDTGRGGAGNLAAALPDTLAQLVRVRIAGIHPGVQRVLLAAAALAEPPLDLSSSLWASARWQPNGCWRMPRNTA
jgi:hypothetical protein